MEQIDELIKKFMASQDFKTRLGMDLDLTSPVTLTYAIERLIITHVKLWQLEDLVRDQKLSDAEVGVLKRKIDYMNGIVRPRLVESIGDIFVKAVKYGHEDLVKEPNLKDYQARQ